MAGYNNFYEGADWEMQKGYGMNSDYNHGFVGYRSSASSIGFPSDPTTANQLKAVSDKISTGTKTIEVSGVNIMGGGSSKLIDSIPKQHFTEINRLKKLTGVDLTFHGPLVEPTGFQGRQGWNENDRILVEEEMWGAVSRGHQLDPDGNIVITFHSSNGLMDPEEKIKKDGKEVATTVWTVDDRTGQFSPIELEKKDYFKGKEVKVSEIREKVKKQIEEKNEEDWIKALQSVSYHAYQGSHIIDNAIKLNKNVPEKFKQLVKEKPLEELYKLYLEGKQDQIMALAGPELGSLAIGALQEITHGDLYVRDSYKSFKELFNKAYDAAERSGDKENIKRLDNFKSKIATKVEKLEKDPTMISELSETVVEGVNVLRSINPPQVIRPVRDFAIDKASESFSNVALKAYNEFGEKAPIISIENPPAGSGLHRADDLRELVEESHKKFVKKAVESGMKESEARKVADKLIGVTWDVGHINMIRKMGYDESDLLSETKKIAPYIKHVHLSDNFGIEHTELPMGMGNVPVEDELKIIESELKKKYGDKMKEIKKIVETGDWFSRTGLQLKNTPVPESFAAFGSPIYSMGGPAWNERRGMMGNYFSGRGLNPDLHHQTFGAGYSGLPVELGGQIPGQGRSRFSGTPME